jgi:hypothetical protein
VILAEWKQETMPVFYQAMRDQFSGDDLGRSVLIGALVFGVFFVVLLVVHRLDQRPAKVEEVDHPGLVFRETLQKLGFVPSLVTLFESIVADVRPPHPAALLLSEKLFDENVKAWHKQRGDAPAHEESEALARARARLFPSGVGWITSGPERV